MVRRGLRRLRTFEGRDSRQEFWPYCAAVFFAWVLVGNVCFAAVFIATSGSDRRDVALPFVAVAVLTGTALVLLLASAVTRRLHDRNRSGLWGAVPLLPAAVSIVLFTILVQTFDNDSGPGLFLAVFAVNLVYFATIITLFVQLVLPGISPKQP